MTTLTSPRQGTFWRKFVGLAGAGLVGIVAAVPMVTPMLKNLVDNPPAGAAVPSLPVLVAAQAAQLAVMTGVAVAAGIALASRLGLRSHIAEVAERGGRLWQVIKPDLRPAIAAGAGTGVAIVVLDVLFRPWMPAALQAASDQPRGLVITLAGMLYGGITEELLMRWGLMTLLAWALWRVFQRGTGAPRGWIMWLALGAVAIVFGVAHLGAVALITPLTPLLIARTVLLNAVGGIVFGWLYWRRSLEAAMIAHASAHVAMTLLSVLALQFMR